LKRLLAGWSQSNWPQPKLVDLAAELPLRTNVDIPDHVGVDRLLDAVAANLLRSPDQPAIIIDSGTATTVNAVSAGGVFEGGAILPGLALQARSLHEYTALLPLVDVQSLAANPVGAVGRNTHGAIKSGIWFGQVGAIRELTARFANSFGRPPLLLVTGGMGRWLTPALGEEFRFEPDLALRGLAFVAQLPSNSN
jgi:type III pantothenate kinase